MTVPTQTKDFPLAKMSRGIFVLTAILFPLPFGFLLAPLFCPDAGQLVWPGLALGIIWVWVWTWFRPSRFEVSPQGLRIVWPIRSRQIDAYEMLRADIVSPEDIRDEYRWAVRIGAGGLWGAFGLLWTRRGSTGMYVSRTDGLVLIRHRSTRPLLITPENPEGFVEALGGLAE